MRFAILCLVGAGVFVLPCAWDSDPYSITPVQAIIAKFSARETPPEPYVPQDGSQTDRWP
jgi:hypothetical protein